MKKKIFLTLLSFALVSGFLLGGIALAQPETGLEYVESTGLSDTDPRIVAANIIRIFLGFLGVIALGIILYAGWLWMSSEGNEEKIGKAKKILISATIGFILILSSFAIASFILRQLITATTGQSGDPNNNPYPGGGSIGPYGGLISCDSNPLTPDVCDKDASRCREQQYCGSDCYCHDKGGYGDSCNATTTPGVCAADNEMCKTYLDCKADKNCRCYGAPVITSVSPVTDDASSTPNGAPGNFITIEGMYFGTTTGKVYFSDNTGSTTVSAPFPQTVNPKCIRDWQENRIIVIVPNGAADGPLKVVRAQDGASDMTNDVRGPMIPDFDVNATKRPGLCLAEPDNGQYKDALSLYGINFNMGADKQALFGNLKSSVAADNPGGWTDINMNCEVPNIKNANTAVFLKINNIRSNSLPFLVYDDSQNGPSIDYIDPSEGPRGQYITIYGKNFLLYKNNASFVNFLNIKSGATSTADGFDMPEVCRDKWWNDKYIIVKVPQVIDSELGEYQVTVTNRDDRTSAPAPKNFIIKVGNAGPGLCLLDPHNGPISTQINSYGDNLGTLQGQSRALFYNNIEATKYDNWSDQNVKTEVPIGSISGPYKIRVNRSNVATYSNSLPFMVGKCSSDSDCNLGEYCCQSGTYWDGICRAPFSSGESREDVCMRGNPVSGYGWTFSTALPRPDTCAGFTNIEACADAGNCPNSPGTCQNATSSPVGNGCGNDYCSYYYPKSIYDSVSPFTSYAQSQYQSDVNRCVIPGQRCDATSSALVDGFTTECRQVGNDFVWQYNPRSTSCSGSSFMDVNGWCTAGTPSSPTRCDLCPGGYSCQANKCVSPRLVCPENSTCNANGQCITNQTKCECCCNKNNGDKDCCYGLECVPGDCGGGDPYGLCSNCLRDGNANGTATSSEAADVAASNNACNCFDGYNNRYCELSNPKYPTGVCLDSQFCDADPNTAVCNPDNVLCGQGKYCNPDNCKCEQALLCDNDKSNSTCEPNADLCSQKTTYVQYCAPENLFYSHASSTYTATTSKYANIEACHCYPKQCNSNNDPAICTASTTMCDISVGEECNQTTCLCERGGLNGGDPCYSTSTLMCDLNCKNPYTCLGKNGEDASGPECTDKSCLCCCDPNANPPQQNAYGLACFADKYPCTNNQRGLFCGCTADYQCNEVSYNSNDFGCGNDTCCRPRPEVESVYPADTTDNVCRNTKISATFNQLMSPNSFAGNMIIVGDYSSRSCPSGLQLLVKESERSSLFANLFYNVKYLFRKISGVFTGSAIAYEPPSATHNYCALPGKVSAYNTADSKTIINFYPTKMLDAGLTYYAIIKGDPDLLDNKGEGVLSYYGIGLHGDNTEKFNAQTYSNSYVWQFTTLGEQAENNGVCAIDHIYMYPDSYLFSQTENDAVENDSVDADAGNPNFDTVYDRDKVFNAEAQSKDNQFLAPIQGAYNWSWSWNIDNPNIAAIINVNNIAANRRLIGAVEGITDGHTFTNAITEITEDDYINPSTVGTRTTGTSDIWVFVCDNPWPPKNNGLWSPWTDRDNNCTVDSNTCQNTNYQIYYCRDDGDANNTVDDLPAILDSSVVRSSSTLQNILKEFYFFREAQPEQSSGLVVDDLATSGAVRASWNAVAGAAGYKVYYGLKSKTYTYYVSATTTQATITGLKNKTPYYFAVTSYNSKNVESDLSSEVSAIPTDSHIPQTPANVSAVSMDKSLKISWNANSDDTVKYKAFLGTNTGVYGTESAYLTTTSHTFDQLNNNTTYYIVVKAFDKYNNESHASAEVSAQPRLPAPINLQAIPGGETVRLSWNSGGGNVSGFKIFYGTGTGNYTNNFSVSGVNRADATKLATSTTYYFAVRAFDSSGNESDYSQEATATTN